MGGNFCPVLLGKLGQHVKNSQTNLNTTIGWPKCVPAIIFPRFWGVFVLKSGFEFGHWKCHFSCSQNHLGSRIWGVRKMSLLMPETKIWINDSGWEKQIELRKKKSHPKLLPNLFKLHLLLALPTRMPLPSKENNHKKIRFLDELWLLQKSKCLSIILARGPPG